MVYFIIGICSTTERSFQLLIFSILLFPLVILSIVEGTHHHDHLSSITSRSSNKPSRPPAPLLQGSGNDFITLYLRLDPNDDVTRTMKEQKDHLFSVHQNNLKNKNVLPRYELQSEDIIKKRFSDTDDESIINLFLGQWKNSKIGTIQPDKKHSSSSYLFPVVVTVPNLSFGKLYRFRVRVLNTNGSTRLTSPWSSPSEIMETDSSTPNPPIGLHVVARMSTSIKLSWKQNKAEPMANFFHLQYRLQILDEVRGDVIDNDNSINSGIDLKQKNALSWKDYPEDIIATSSVSLPEVQEITTLVNDDSSITKGLFWLKLKVAYGDPTLRSNVLKSSTISKPISFNATVEEFEDAVKNIRGIRSVRVFRYKPGFWGTSDKPYRGTFSWRVEFQVIGHTAPLFEFHKDNLNGEYSDGFVRCRVRRLLQGQPPVYKKEINITVNELQSEKYYEFRARGINSFGKGPWGSILFDVKTDVPLFDKPTLKASKNQLNSRNVNLVAGKGFRAGNDADPDYMHGTAMGGFDREDGSDGLVVIIQRNNNKLIIPSRINFYFTGRPEQFVVPENNQFKNKERSIDYIDVKLWGAGGAGGGTTRNYTGHYQDGFSYGGGGGFVQTRLKVYPNEVLTIQVGGGGKYHRLDEREIYPVNSGFLGGGQGGRSTMGPHGGSGGGYSVLKRDGHVLALAGGGGGGGATDYCCAHGGEGGGTLGGNGTSPDTPLYIGKDAAASNGMSRNEFTAQDCTTSDCIDSRDKTGLPAFHKHLDRGFAPNASYDTNSQGGFGGSQDLPGASGKSSKYDILDNHVSTIALPGVHGLGGKGADGKEAGGGGGAGYMGGGGGGSGVDGSGGGGGSGFVDFPHVFIFDQSAKNLIPDQPPAPLVTSVSHDSFEIKWRSDLGRTNSKIGKHIRVFDIEMSRGRNGAADEGSQCSDEYKLVDRIQVSGVDIMMNTTINGLHSKTVYCVLLVAIGDIGTSKRSHKAEIITEPLPENKWVDIYPREDLDAMRNRPNVEDIIDPSQRHPFNEKCEIPFRPASRRGHSFTRMDGNIYLFGGIIEECICDEDNKKCKKRTIHSNEVWSFNVYTKIWKLLSPSTLNNSIPVGREKHSATRLENGKILIIGGKSDTSPFQELLNKPMFLGDVWEMDPGQTSSHLIDGLSKPQIISEGSVSYHSTHVTIKNEPQYREGMLCVKKISVEIAMEHPCIEQLGHIALQKSETSDLPIRRNSASEAKLFIGSSHSSKSGCTSLILNITLSDSADESILDYGSKIPNKGHFQPAQHLGSHFVGSPTDGQWVLSIFDSTIDQMKGTLINWKLHFDATYCDEGIHWSKLSTNSNSCENTIITNGKSENRNCSDDCGRHEITREIFHPRYSHTAIAVGNDVFVIGGYAHGIMSEIWRFNYATKDWIQLNDSLNRPKFHGQTAVLTPFGMITIGGIRNGILGAMFTKRAFLYDVLNETEAKLDVNFNISSIGYNPESRYSSSASYIGQTHFLFDDTLDNTRETTDEAILMFGGDMGLPRNNHLEDLWVLSLQNLASMKRDLLHHRARSESCRNLLSPNKTALNPWDWTCGSLAHVNTSKSCRWEDVVRKAWCLGQYQDFASPL